MIEHEYTITVTQDLTGDYPGWVASVKELPGCITQGDTLAELGEMLAEAIEGWLEADGRQDE